MNGRYETTMPNEHLGDRAELYALGVLDRDEADRINSHAAGCADCARSLAAAEMTVTLLDDASLARRTAPVSLARRIGTTVAREAERSQLELLRARRYPPALRLGAVAAAFALAFGLAAGTRSMLHLRAVTAQDDAALAVIANSHFKHATLTKTDPAAPTSKVLWGIGKRWIYVIVDTPACGCRIVVTTSTGQRDLGAPLARGQTAVVFANELPPVQRVELQRDGNIVESATIP